MGQRDSGGAPAASCARSAVALTDDERGRRLEVTFLLSTPTDYAFDSQMMCSYATA